MPLKEDGILKSDPSESQESKANRLETPEDVYYFVVDLSKKLGIPPPELDVFASQKNTKCINFITKEQDAFKKDFLIDEINRGIETTRVPETIWSNAPHGDYAKALRRIFDQYKKYDFNAVILIPTVNCRTNYWHELVEPNRLEVNKNGFAFYYPLQGTIYFELDGQFLIDKNGRKSHAHNAYNVLWFVKKTKVKDFKENLVKVLGK